MIDNNKRDYVNSKKISVGIVLGGEVNNYDHFALELAACDYTVCADGGAKHLARINFLPDLLVGDFDSIDKQDLEKLVAAGVPSRQFSPEKNMTDSELAVDAAIDFVYSKITGQDFLNQSDNKSDNKSENRSDIRTENRSKKESEKKADVRICLLAATGDRPDHVFANQLMAASKAREGYDVMMSDGVSRFYFLEGPVSKTFKTDIFDFDFVVSAIAVSDQVSGLSYEGLKYPLDKYELKFGSQRGVSNCLVTKDSSRRKGFSVSIESGTLMLVITPDR